jgi:hypothetical protein
MSRPILRAASSAVVLLGALLLAISVPEVTLSQSCCVTPTTYPSTDAGPGEVTGPNGNNGESRFYETLSGGTFTGQAIQESAGLGEGQNNCFFSTSTLPQHPAIPTATPWTVGTYVLTNSTATAPPNVWGYDYIGFNNQAIQDIMLQVAAGQLPHSCTITAPQNIAIMCNDSTFFVYESDTVSSTISLVSQSGSTFSFEITNCRGNPQVCALPITASVN